MGLLLAALETACRYRRSAAVDPLVHHTFGARAMHLATTARGLHMCCSLNPGRVGHTTDASDIINRIKSVLQSKICEHILAYRSFRDADWTASSAACGP